MVVTVGDALEDLDHLRAERLCVRNTASMRAPRNTARMRVPHAPLPVCPMSSPCAHTLLLRPTRAAPETKTERRTAKGAKRGRTQAH